jgi:flagellar biosynthetic protein FliR
VTLTDTQLLGWLHAMLWPLVRIGGVLATAPVLGARMVPARVRVVLALLLTLALAPVLPPLSAQTLAIAPFAADWFLELARQLLIGIAMGFVLLLVFEAVTLGGELIAYGMGLSFAQLVDPLRGAGTPVVGQILTIAATLLFLSGGGHLRLIEALAASFTSLPVGGSVFDPALLKTLALWGGMLFTGGLQLALPVVIALLLVNLAFGVMNRSAPALNAMSVGFPISLIAGMLLMRFSLPTLQTVLAAMLDQAFLMIGQLGGGHG